MRRNALPPCAGPKQQTATERFDRTGRGGKTATGIMGLPVMQKQRKALLKQLNSRLGAGGTVRDATIHILRDHRDARVVVREKMGSGPKRPGV